MKADNRHSDPVVHLIVLFGCRSQYRSLETIATLIVSSLPSSRYFGWCCSQCRYCFLVDSDSKDGQKLNFAINRIRRSRVIPCLCRLPHRTAALNISLIRHVHVFELEYLFSSRICDHSVGDSDWSSRHSVAVLSGAARGIYASRLSAGDSRIGWLGSRHDRSRAFHATVRRTSTFDGTRRDASVRRAAQRSDLRSER